MNAIPDITALYAAQFQIGILVLVRVSAMLSLLPVLGSTSVPFQVRVALGLAFTIAIFPAIPRSTIVLPTGTPGFFVMVFKEAVTGILIGWVFGLVFQTVEIAGAMIDAQAGYSMVELFDPITGQTSHLFGQFLVAVATVSFMVSGVMAKMVSVLASSFVALPLDASQLRAASVVPILETLASTAFATGIQLAGPVLMALFMVTIVMAVVSRIMPAMNAWMLAMPIQIAVACGVTAAGLPWIMHVFGIWEENVFHGVDRLMAAMG